MAAIIKRLMTAAGILNRLKGVDGAGSGLDADLLDGLEGAAYAKLASANVFTNSQTIFGTGAVDRYMTIGADSGRTRGMLLAFSSVVGWIVGGDGSGNLVIYRYNSSGVFQDTALSISQSTGAVSVANTFDATGGVYDGGVRVARTNAAQTFSARQDINPGGTNICLVAGRGGDISPHIYIDMSSSVNTGDQFVRFVSAGTTSGSITANGASNVAYNTSSDPRLKKDLELLDLTESVERIKALRLWKGKWKIDGSPFRGILTTELQHVIPEAVTGPEDGIEEEWVVGSEEQPRRIIRKPDEDGFAKIEAKAPEDADLHPLGEQIAPQMWDPGKAMPDVMGALQWALGRIDQLEARIAALESA